MNIGIVGLGLIGGSMAKAYKKAGAAVLGCDRDRVVTDFAKMAYGKRSRNTGRNACN